MPLHELTTGHDGGIFNGPQFSRLYVNDPDYGVPFLGSTDMLEADFTNLPLLHKKVAQDNFAYLEVEPGMTMITCSGTVGRTDICAAGHGWILVIAADVLKVDPDPAKILPGYLYAFLQSRYGIPMVVSAAYGAIIQHIEPRSHRRLAGAEVRRMRSRKRSTSCVQAAADLRAQFQAGVTAATRDLFESAGLPELLDFRWHDQPRDTGFAVPRPHVDHACGR